MIDIFFQNSWQQRNNFILKPNVLSEISKPPTPIQKVIGQKINYSFTILKKTAKKKKKKKIDATPYKTQEP